MKQKLKIAVKTVWVWSAKLAVLALSVLLTRARLVEFVLKPSLDFRNLKPRRLGAKTAYVNNIRAKNRHVEYADKVFSDYTVAFCGSQKTKGDCSGLFQGKRVLEIGSGMNLMLPLKILAAGAELVVSVDKFNSLAHDSELYRLFVEGLSPSEREILQQKYALDQLVNYPEKLIQMKGPIEYINNAMETFNSEVEDRRFDYIISRATLEHMRDPNVALKNLCSLLETGGEMVHEIDHRDHGILTHLGFESLDFHMCKKELWGQLQDEFPGLPNRWTAEMYVKAVEQYLPQRKVTFSVKERANDSSVKNLISFLEQSDNSNLREKSNNEISHDFFTLVSVLHVR